MRGGAPRAAPSAAAAGNSPRHSRSALPGWSAPLAAVPSGQSFSVDSAAYRGKAPCDKQRGQEGRDFGLWEHRKAGRPQTRARVRSCVLGQGKAVSGQGRRAAGSRQPAPPGSPSEPGARRRARCVSAGRRAGAGARGRRVRASRESKSVGPAPRPTARSGWPDARQESRQGCAKVRPGRHGNGQETASSCAGTSVGPASGPDLILTGAKQEPCVNFCLMLAGAERQSRAHRNSRFQATPARKQKRLFKSCTFC